MEVHADALAGMADRCVTRSIPLPRRPEQPQPAAATAHSIPHHAPESTHLHSGIRADANIHEPQALPKHRESARLPGSSLPQSRHHCTLAHDDAGLHLRQFHDHRSSFPRATRFPTCLSAKNEYVCRIKLAIAIVEPVLNCPDCHPSLFLDLPPQRCFRRFPWMDQSSRKAQPRPSARWIMT